MDGDKAGKLEQLQLQLQLQPTVKFQRRSARGLFGGL
jgi:hypothetical protein